MTPILHQVIDSLRNELQQYGEMLALLEAQNKLVIQSEPSSVLISLATVEIQSATMEASRHDREKAQRQLAWVLGRPQSATFQDMLPLLPECYRPLVSALVDEIKELIVRVLERATENHKQLRQSLEMMERFIAVISSQAQSALLVGEQGLSGAESQPPRSLVA
jgi:CRP-like cAMP-binding protein